MTALSRTMEKPIKKENFMSVKNRTIFAFGRLQSSLPKALESLFDPPHPPHPSPHTQTILKYGHLV
jgi:hypothetical protein